MIGQSAVSSSLTSSTDCDAGIRERLEAGVVRGAGVSERDELARAVGRSHAVRVRRSPAGYSAPMRVLLAIVAVGVLAAPASAAAPKVRLTAAGNAAARKTLLTAKLMGSGWTALAPVAVGVDLSCKGDVTSGAGVEEVGAAEQPDLKGGRRGSDHQPDDERVRDRRAGQRAVADRGHAQAAHVRARVASRRSRPRESRRRSCRRARSSSPPRRRPRPPTGSSPISCPRRGR